MSRKLESNNVETRSEPWLRWGVCLSSVWWWGSDDVQVCLIKDQVKSGAGVRWLGWQTAGSVTLPPLPEGESHAVALTPGREGGRPAGWCRTGTLGKPPGRIWGSGDHGGTGDSGGQGGYGDSDGHGGSGASGGHGGYGVLRKHRILGALGMRWISGALGKRWISGALARTRHWRALARSRHWRALARSRHRRVLARSGLWNPRHPIIYRQ